MEKSSRKSSRRGFMWKAAATGAAATAAVTLPKVQAPATSVAEAAPAPPERGGGYRHSEHVERYYKSTRF
jgi:hypothetical protein